MDRMNIAVIFGGCSPEYAVSLQSAHAVITHMDSRKFFPVLLGISKTGEWFRYNGGPEKIRDDTWCNPQDCNRAIISPSRELHGVLEFRPEGIHPLRLDGALPVLHGKNGEDGTVQGLLELAGVPVAGCGTLSSALCMDKDKAHKLAHLAGVRVPRSFLLRSLGEAATAGDRAAEAGLAYPLFVKPVKAGSSFGITKADRAGDLRAAAELAFQYDDTVIAEEAIPGFEVGCAVLGNEELIVGQVDEIELTKGFFDFDEKYSRLTSAIHLPARIPPEKAAEIQRTAKIIYNALGCRGFARVDMFVTPQGEIVFNEVNTIPGFTARSRYPSMLREIGLSFGEVVNTIIDLAVAG